MSAPAEIDADWPNRETSRLVEVERVRWHVQYVGQGPAILLLHGTGASSHSYRDVLLPLARHFTVVVPDLPGHAFTRAPRSLPRSLPNMARLVAGLLCSLNVSPVLIVGHSAGAAIAAQMVLDGRTQAQTLVSINGAFTPFRGIARTLLPAMAKTLAALDWPARRIAQDAHRPHVVDRMLNATGSLIDETGRELYTRLVQSEEHVRGTVAMTAAWDLAPLAARLPRLPCRIIAVSGSRDKTVPPDRARRLVETVPDGVFVDWAGLGHLAHEEEPDKLVTLVVNAATDRSI